MGWENHSEGVSEATILNARLSLKTIQFLEPESISAFRSTFYWTLDIFTTLSSKNQLLYAYKLLYPTWGGRNIANRSIHQKTNICEVNYVHLVQAQTLSYSHQIYAIRNNRHQNFSNYFRASVTVNFSIRTNIFPCLPQKKLCDVKYDVASQSLCFHCQNICQGKEIGRWIFANGKKPIRHLANAASTGLWSSLG